MAEAANDTSAAREDIDAAPAPAAPAEAVERADWDFEDGAEFEIEGPGLAERLPAIGLVLLALGWIGFVAWAAWTAVSQETPSPTAVANWIAVASIPLALIGVLWLLLRRTSRREALRFGQTAEAMRTEAKRLDFAMRMISSQIAAMRESVTSEAERLMALGDEASGRLGHIGEDMRSAGRLIEEKTGLLDRAARAAREDVQVLMTDLPRAEEQARTVSAGLRDAGVNALEQAVSLDAQLTALASRGREADEIASGAAQRLAAHLAQIEGISEVAAKRIDETGTHINSAVEAALDQSSAAVEETRRAVDEIGKAMAAMVESAGASFDKSGGDAAEALSARIQEVGQTISELEERLDAQKSSTEMLLVNLDNRLRVITERLAGLGETGGVQVSTLGEHIAALQQEMAALGGQIGGNDEAAERLIARAAEVKAALDLSAATLAGELPEKFSAVETRAAEVKATLAALAPEVGGFEESVGHVASYFAASEETLKEQREAVERLVESVGERILTIREALDGFEATLSSTDEQARIITEASTPRLIEALMRVRETADQAAEKARSAFGEVIPQSAAALSEATRLAMTEALGENVEARMAEISTASERAIEAARLAAEHLGRKIEEVATASAAIEARLEEARAEADASDMDGFARRVTLLIESLNSTAIDVTKILSNEVTDSAWAAYLKGDRGIFARRAVRLLDTGEAREIARHYEEEPEFHEQVNRYIHDFEAMLRRVLATRDGSPLAVTLLSSDNGKLYVALAQAIERFRD